MELSQQVKRLLDKGVKIYNPYSVEIGEEISTDRIARGCTLHAGTRLRGAQTYIAEGAFLGAETQTTVEDCFIGPEVRLNGGLYKKAVFLKGAVCGSGSHVREGTLLEEGASIAHTVGLKQTILFPFVTLGSLINFCDCLMAGGTDRSNHSEVGSSFIHFNFTANQDKATPSLIGDVPRGVMLNQAPIFLGGQGGLVGPSRVAYGTVLAAGSILRGDQLEENRVIFAGTATRGSLPFKPGGYRSLKKVLLNNFHYIGNLKALEQWYRIVRSRFIGPEFPSELFEGALRIIATGIRERSKQLERLVEKIEAGGVSNTFQQNFVDRWPELKTVLENQNQPPVTSDLQEGFLVPLDKTLSSCEKSYLSVIRKLSADHSAVGSKWLEGIVSSVVAELNRCLAEADDAKTGS